MTKSITLGTVAALLAAAVLAGCEKPVAPDPGVNFYLRSEEDLRSVRSVAFLDLMEESPTQGVNEEITQTLTRALRNKRLFNLDFVSRKAPIYRLMPITSACEPLTLKEMSDMRTALGCDAVLYGTVTSFEPYPHTRIGLRLRLVDLRKGMMIWGVDHVWEASDKKLQRRMELYFESELGEEYQPMNWRLATVSPRAFEGFVAYETVKTLTPKSPPAENEKP